MPTIMLPGLVLTRPNIDLLGIGDIALRATVVMLCGWIHLGLNLSGQRGPSFLVMPGL